MKKFSFLLFHKEYESFLEQLRSIGLIHVNEKEGGVEDPQFDETIQELSRVDALVKEFVKLNGDKNTLEDSAGVQKYESVDTVLEAYNKLVEERDTLVARQQQVEKFKEVWLPWGDFDISKLEKLKDAGWNLEFYSCNSRDWNDEWDDKYDILNVAQIGVNRYFVVISSAEDTVSIEADKVELPEISFSESNREADIVKDKIALIEEQLVRLTKVGLPLLEDYQLEIQDRVDFAKVRLNGDKMAENHVYLLEGFVPEEKADEIRAFLEKERVYYEESAPSYEEKVPVLLKNNRFVRMFEMIGDLYSLPKYGELDLTPYFAPFYLLFFGFCLGDAGYGLLLMILGFVFTPKTTGATKSAMQLCKWLGASTILFGLIGGTFFGINLYDEGWGFYGNLSQMLKAQGKTMNDHLFNLALIFGAIQVIFGMVLKAVNEAKQFGVRYAVGTIGWITLFVGLVLSYFLPSFGVSEGFVSIFRYVVVGFWALVSLFFSNPDRSIFANVGAGVWDSYNMATGVMGDILSYIRLFALGISSSILGFVFNNLAVQFAPENIVGKIIVMTIILIIGHGLNLFMGVLGSFVHPVRLTFVEFYKNSGFTGGGIRYNPFRKRVK
ncbi:V-type ATP synthase subunit I [Halosquirtibacter xylanolyticus]|uniref:V-type ATP synthase subunit I n=1 Tax=Halosquirtibacter xylanolyticus TaxID=3374599 RepID=UPI0037480E68|nr:V-type ATP synthase subunit I [Prolixibacteraceae bacterium]